MVRYPKGSLDPALRWRDDAPAGADIFPAVGALPIAAITPRQMLEAFRAIQARGSVEMAHRVRNHCSEVFRYAIPDGRCESDPCRDLAPGMAKPAPVKHHAKVAAKDLPEFFGKLSRDGGDRTSHLALRWTMLTMVHTQETRFAQWAELEGLDTAEPIWRIPPERMKMSTEHIVPLPPQAIAMLNEIRERNVYLAAGNEKLGAFLFPVHYSKSLVISENRMLDVMYRVGLRGKATVYGFRGLASTVLNESGLFEPDRIEFQLAHAARGVRAAYNSACYLVHTALSRQPLHRSDIRTWRGNVPASILRQRVEAEKPVRSSTDLPRRIRSGMPSSI